MIPSNLSRVTINGRRYSYVSGELVPELQARTERGAGIIEGNPRLCLHCQEPIRQGEQWIKHTSEPDPEFGAYSVIIHEHCSGKG